MGQDWSEVWLQRFSGTVTVWPKTVPSDLYYILSDPTTHRLARMLHEGQQSAYPKIKFISNRMKLENAIAEGMRKYVNPGPRVDWHVDNRKSVTAHTTLRPWENAHGPRYERVDLLTDNPSRSSDEFVTTEERDTFVDTAPEATREDRPIPSYRRSSSFMQEFRRQSAVFFDDDLYETGPSDEDRMTSDKRDGGFSKAGRILE